MVTPAVSLFSPFPLWLRSSAWLFNRYPQPYTQMANAGKGQEPSEAEIATVDSSELLQIQQVLHTHRARGKPQRPSACPRARVPQGWRHVGQTAPLDPVPTHTLGKGQAGETPCLREGQGAPGQEGQTAPLGSISMCQHKDRTLCLHQFMENHSLGRKGMLVSLLLLFLLHRLGN